MAKTHYGVKPDILKYALGSTTGQEFQVEPEAFRTLVLERLRLPLSKFVSTSWEDTEQRALGRAVTHQSSANGEDSGENVS